MKTYRLERFSDEIIQKLNDLVSSEENLIEWLQKLWVKIWEYKFLIQEWLVYSRDFKKFKIWRYSNRFRDDFMHKQYLDLKKKVINDTWLSEQDFNKLQHEYTITEISEWSYIDWKFKPKDIVYSCF